VKRSTLLFAAILRKLIHDPDVADRAGVIRVMQRNCVAVSLGVERRPVVLGSTPPGAAENRLQVFLGDVAENGIGRRQIGELLVG